MTFQDDIEKINGKIHEMDCKEAEIYTKLNEAYSLVNTLSDKIHYLEKSSFNNEQHTRKWNIEIDGIPVNIGDDRNQLEKAVLEILRAINVNCVPTDIEAKPFIDCYRNLLSSLQSLDLTIEKQ